MIGDEGLGCERLQDAARHFIGTENWTMADACLKMAMRLAVDHGHSGELFSMFEVVCGSMNSWEMGERWLRELIEEVEEVSEFHSHDGPYSSESKDILLPALGRLRYRGGVDDVVTCFERARWNHTTHDVDFARRQLQAKRWLLEAKGPDDAVGWESKLNDFLHDVRSNALGESVEDYVIIGKSCFGNGQFADSYMKNDPSDASRYHEEAKEWYERALLHLRLALAILPDDHIESVREEIVDPLYWCGRAAFEVGEYVVAISCFERSNGKWPSPDCEEWLEMARLAAAA